MKKIILTAFLICSVWVAKAQYVGLKAGYNYAALNGEVIDGASVQNSHGFYAGASLELPFSKIFSVQGEAIYSRQGAKIDSAVGSCNLVLDYLAIPALAKINVYKGLSFCVGPHFNFLVNHREFSFLKDDVKTEISDKALDKFDFSLTAGLIYKVRSGWFIEARFSEGMTNILEGNNTNLHEALFGNDYNFKNRIISAGVGYVF